MKHITNIFKIENLSEISAQYRVFDIKGLKKGKDYQENKQFLIKKFSNTLRHPVTIIEMDGEPKLIVKNDADIIKKIATEYDGGRIYLHFNLSDKVFDIDFANPTDETKKICLRFLQFDLNGELKKNPNLWQPKTGDPFFLKTPEIQDGIAIYKGFTFRVIELPQNGFGIVIDATRKFASAKPLPYYINRTEFDRRYKERTFIYQYKDWYEIKAMELDDFNVSEYKIEGTPLIDFVRNAVAKPHSPQLANMPSDSSTLIYYGSQMADNRTPAGLCYQVFDFQDTNNAEINRKSIIPPQIRFSEIMNTRKQFFHSIKYGKSFLKLSEKTVEAPQNIFPFPEFELGNNNILSAHDFKPNEFQLAGKIAKTRLHRLMNSEIGFYSKSPLPNQIIVLPRSVNDAKGEVFLRMLKDTVNKMYPSDTYNPDLIVFEDKFRQGTDYIEIGKQIVNAVKSNFPESKLPGFGVVMIPRLERKAKREHDKLGALIIRELKKVGLHCSIMHDDTIRECFGYKNTADGKVQYYLKNERAKKFEGYVRGVAINKVLLNCSKWPFVLNEPLNADLTIGIDVKHHTAGFTIVDKHGKNIRTETDETSNKEKLAAEQLKSWLFKIVKDEVEYDTKANIDNIVIHRDGRLFDTELEGLLQGLQQLKDEMCLSPDAELHILEIPKSSLYSVRIFGLSWDNQKQRSIIENPPVGMSFYFNDEAFLCSTGKEFSHSGTSNPLNVKFTYGIMSKKELLSDLFKLTTLAFTKPDDCSRVPITNKMNDVKLSDAASEYDEDAYRQLEILKTELNLN